MQTKSFKVTYAEAVAIASRLGMGLYDALRSVYKPLSLRYYKRFSRCGSSVFILTLRKG